MDRRITTPWLLCTLCVLCGSGLRAFALDREAFTFTNYDLNLQIDPAQHRLAVHGKIMLRNDSSAPQKIAVLQISSSLDWRAIKVADKPVQFVTQPYASDIDHTGALSEAIVTLPQPVAPKGTVELEIGYEGVIMLDATRLTRIGTPEDAATSTDWDEISADFTAVRGAGYVAWYPIATESADLAVADSLFAVLGRWKARETEAKMELGFALPVYPDDSSTPAMLCSGKAQWIVIRGGSPKWPGGTCSFARLGATTPAFLIGDLQFLERPAVEVYYSRGRASQAISYADESEKLVPFITEVLGAPREKARTADLPDPKAAPFEIGSLLLTPLANDDSKLAALAAAHQLAHAAFSSVRPWIDEGLAHFAQALYLEREKGRSAALDYMGLHRSAFSEVEKTLPHSEDEVKRALVNTTSEELYRSKAMYVWWMLRDMIGDAALKKAIAAYRSEDDKDPAYMQRLIAAQTQRDLAWFFDDWVYHDRGLPDFKVVSAFSTRTAANTTLVTITVENLGGAGAEVPVIVRFAGGETTQRLEVRGKSKAVFRVELSSPAQEIQVNDGSVPESNMTNNVFKVEAAESNNSPRSH